MFNLMSFVGDCFCCWCCVSLELEGVVEGGSESVEERGVRGIRSGEGGRELR